MLIEPRLLINGAPGVPVRPPNCLRQARTFFHDVIEPHLENWVAPIRRIIGDLRLMGIVIDGPQSVIIGMYG